MVPGQLCPDKALGLHGDRCHMLTSVRGKGLSGQPRGGDCPETTEAHTVRYTEGRVEAQANLGSMGQGTCCGLRELLEFLSSAGSRNWSLQRILWEV